MLDYIRFAVLLAASASAAVVSFRHREWRGGLAIVSVVFLAAAAREIAWVAAGVVLALANRGTVFTGLKAVYDNRRFRLLALGACAASFAAFTAHETAGLVAGSAGCAALLAWSVLFLKDKYRVFPRRVSPLNRLILENELVEVGRGTRRVTYRVGDTGYCAKFYYPHDLCVIERKINRGAIVRDIEWRRFNKFRNSSSREVFVYNLFRHTMPEEIRKRMPEVCERVYHEEWGWGVIETYYTNPDGTAILPYEFEIARQTPENREKIYEQAVSLLKTVIKAGALLYEPGNFHVLIRPDGEMELKLVDFEPESKTAIPLEMYLTWFRRLKLMRKARRYLKHIREAYGVKSGMRI